MAAPMVNVLVNPSYRFTIKHGIRMIVRQSSLINLEKCLTTHVRHKHDGKLVDHEHVELSKGDEDFFGVTEFYDSIPPYTNPSVGLEKEQIKKKYNIQEQRHPENYEVVNVPYGCVRLDSRVAQQFKTSEQGLTRVRKRRKRERSTLETNGLDGKQMSHDSYTIKDSSHDNCAIDNSSYDYISKNSVHSCNNTVKDPRDIYVEHTRSVGPEDENDLNISTNYSFSKTDNEKSKCGTNIELSESFHINKHTRTSEAEMPYLKKKSSLSYLAEDEVPGSDMTKSLNEEKLNFIDQAYFDSLNIKEDRKVNEENDELFNETESSKTGFVSDKFPKLNYSKAFNEEKQYDIDQDYTGSSEIHVKEPVEKQFLQTFQQESTVDDNFIDEQYFGQTVIPDKSKSDLNSTLGKPMASLSGFDDIAKFNSVSEGKLNMEGKLSINVKTNIESTETTESYDNFIDDQYFSTSNHSKYQILDPEDMHQIDRSGDQNSDQSTANQLNEGRNDTFDKDFYQSGETKQVESESTGYKMELFKQRKDKESLSSAEEAVKQIQAELNQPVKDSTEDTKPESKVLRRSKELRSKLGHMTLSEITAMLYDNIVYNKDDVVALNKPYGLACQDGPDIHVSIGHCLEKLKNLIDPGIDKLHLINKIDKDMTGVIMLAKTEQMAWRLKAAFTSKQVITKYFLVTKGVPKPEEGIIDIPMAEGKVEGKYRMVLRPQGYSKQKGTTKAVTQYKVLTSTNSTALVECTPITGVKHQVRAHMFYGLNTPVLGDHKYSHLSKIAPQKLFPDMLTRLKLRQAEVRNLPLHLHARSLIIPEFLDGRNLYVQCRIPDFFVTNMKKLKLDFKQFL